MYYNIDIGEEASLLRFILIFLILFINFEASASDKLILTRINKMQESDRIMNSIKKNILESDFTKAGQNIKNIKNWADIMIQFFPQGSEASETNFSSASNDIWKEFEKFKDNVNIFRANANKMFVDAQNNDLNQSSLNLVFDNFSEALELKKYLNDKYQLKSITINSN